MRRPIWFGWKPISYAVAFAVTTFCLRPHEVLDLLRGWL